MPSSHPLLKPEPFDWRALRSSPGTVPVQHLENMADRLVGARVEVELDGADPQNALVELTLRVHGEMQWKLNLGYKVGWYFTRQIKSLRTLSRLTAPSLRP